MLGRISSFLDVFFLIETTCTAWFTIEAIVRFIACPSKLAFWRDFKNIVDVAAVLPYYVTLFNVLSTMSCEGAKSSASPQRHSRCCSSPRVLVLVLITSPLLSLRR